jgi:hypothetical protein
MGEKIISQRTLTPQLWKLRKNSKHSHKTSCYWLNIIGKLHTSHGKFHYEWNSRELLPQRHLGHLRKKLHNSWRKLHKVLLGSSLDFHAGDAYELLPGKIAHWMKIQRVTQKASVKLDNLHSGWKTGSYPKVACKELAQWMKTWMKMDETSLFKYFIFIFANPSIIQFFDHFKMFLHKFELGIWRRWLSKKKSTN